MFSRFDGSALKGRSIKGLYVTSHQIFNMCGWKNPFKAKIHWPHCNYPELHWPVRWS